ncbi:MAG TPA: pyridoxamine 5'-phosphate oxidase family protein [Candidatus Limiplasma sp.]|nr:pyridoxamine 5'-phosphate oxidase family protein [Candidatus Limiplasma sp.]HRX07663.1 pyridoxamine 5'-phosphate oxidase family protein [Candidatus Limiplasma sp.]
MRRKDREITDSKQMEAILRGAKCLRLGLVDNGLAYIVPMSFGMATEGGALCLYFHSAPEGRKIELIEAAGIASFEADTDIRTIEAEEACEFSSSYQSVMGYGKIEILRSEDEKRRALQVLMEHYTDKAAWEFPDKSVGRVVAIKLTVEAMTGKASPAKDAE